MMDNNAITNPDFFQLAKAFFGRRQHDIRDTPVVIEIEIQNCLVTASPNPRDARLLIVSVGFPLVDDRKTLTSPAMLEVMHRLNANSALASDWRYVITHDGNPLLVTNVPLEGMSVDDFEVLVMDAVEQGDRMLAIARVHKVGPEPKPSTDTGHLTVIRG